MTKADKEAAKAMAKLEGLVDWAYAILDRYNVTQTDIAIEMDVTNATLSQLLTGKTDKPHQLTVNALETWLIENESKYTVSKAYMEGAS